MADDDGSRRPPQAYVTVSPAGLGTTTTNQVSPGTLQEILDSGNQSLIDQALDQLTADDLTRYLQFLPSPPGIGRAVSPAGVGTSARSRTPSTGARTPHRGNPSLSSGARTHRGSPRLSLGGPGRASTPRGRPRRGRGRGRGRPRRPQPSPSLPWSPAIPSQQATQVT